MKSILKVLCLVIILNNVSIAQFYEKTFDLGVRSYGWSIKKTQTGYKMSGMIHNIPNDIFQSLDVFTLDFADNAINSNYTIFSSASRDIQPEMNHSISSDYIGFLVNQGYDDMYLAKLSGKPVEVKYTFGDTQGYAICTDKADNVYISGYVDSGSEKPFLIKYDKDLQFQYSYQYSFQNSTFQSFWFYGNYLLKNENILNVGRIYYDEKSLISVLDNLGNDIFSGYINYIESNYFYSGTELENNEIVCVGNNSQNGFICKFTQNGDLINAYSLRVQNETVEILKVINNINDYYILGNVIHNNGKKEPYILKIANNGKIINRFAYSNYVDFALFQDFWKYTENDVVICGSVGNGAKEKPLFIKTNSDFSTCSFKKSNINFQLVDVTKSTTFVKNTLLGQSNYGTSNYNMSITKKDITPTSSLCQIIQPTPCGTGSFEWNKIKSKYAEFNFVKRAAFADSTIYLTDNNFMEVGTVWSQQKKYVTKGFRTNFTFSMSQGNNFSSVDNSIPGADGIVFILQNNSNLYYGPSGGALGYDYLQNALAFEFDTFNNPEYKDPNGNHFAIQSSKKGIISMIHKPENTLFMNDKIPQLEQNKKYTCQIEYLEDLKTLTVYLDTREDLATKVEIAKLNNFILEDHINITDGRAYVGFTSSTGTATENHKINNWDLCLFGEDPNTQSDVLIEETNPDIQFDEIRVFDLLGREVLNINNYDDLNVNLNKLNNGLFIVNKYLKGNYLTSHKLIKN